MSGMRRERSQPLLRSALIALGAGGGLMVAGCVLWDAGPASAQTMLTANPYPVGAAVAHYRPHGPASGHAHRPGAPSHHGSTKSGHAGRSGGTARTGGASAQGNGSQGSGLHASTLTSPSATTAANPAATAVPLSATGPTATTGQTAVPGSINLASGSQPANQSPSTAGPHGRPVHADSLNGPTSTRSNGVRRKTSRLTSTGAAPAPGSNQVPPASPPSSGRSPSSTVLVPANGATRPERLPRLPLGPFAFVPAAAGPGPSPAPLGIVGSPLPLFGLNPLNPFHLPFGIPRGWAGQTVTESARLKVPLALLAAMAVFVLVQSLIDRRDPKLSRAPEHPGEDSVGFE